MLETGLFLTESVIREKSRRIQPGLNLLPLPESKSEMRFTNAWLYRFKQRQKFKR